MQKPFALVVALGLLALAQYAVADALFVNCPTVFNSDVSNITMYAYFGNPPVSGCGDAQAAPRQCGKGTVGSLNVLVDNATDDLIACTCDQANKPGTWIISVSTPISRTYNVTAYIINGTAPEAHSADYVCTAKRVSASPNYTVPELSPVLIPLLMFAAILILRKRKR